MEKFNVTKQRKIVYCVVDNLDLCLSGWAREININLSDFLIHRCITQGYDVYIGKDQNDLLQAAQEDGFYSHAVIVASGTSLKLSDRLFPAVENLCKTDFFVAGHIIDREQSYYELHHQFYVVNLAEYASLGCPVVNQPEEKPHSQTEPLRSTDLIQGDYDLPKWIKPGTLYKTYERKKHGSDIIALGLSHNKPVVDLGDAIRSSKKYIYFEYEHVFLREVSNIYYFQFFCNNFFAGWNSDALRKSIPFDGPVDQYITVGIGFYWIKNLVNIGVTEDTTVIFTDINLNCLKFMQAMVEQWDGVDYATLYKNHLSILPNNFPGSFDTYVGDTARQWDEFRATFDNWDETWAKIKQLKFKYILVDYMANYDLSWITPGKRTLVNLSDVFTHGPYVGTQSLKYRVACENRIINNLNNADPEIVLMLTSRAADGYHSNKNRIMFGKVKEFDLTDLADMKRPVWHQSDWSSLRLLN